MKKRLCTTIMGLAMLAITFHLNLCMAEDGQDEMTVVAVAAELGFTPESVVAIGLHNDPALVLQRLASNPELRVMYTAQRNAALQASELLAALHMQVRARGDGLALPPMLQSTIASAQADIEAFAATREILLAFVIEAMPQAARTRFQHWRSTAGITMPASFRIAERNDREWRRIANALRQEQRAQRQSTLLPTATVALLAEIRTDSEVVAAQARLNSHLQYATNVFGSFQQ